ncbi:MAG: pyridoxal-phosphate dependent enzyme [Conexivisphaerales archaeon]
MNKIEVFCSVCKKPREREEDFRCSCGNPFEVSLNFPFSPPNNSESRLLRYSGNFPYVDPSRIVELGERITPLVEENDGSLLKLDYFNPTFSFKDRGSQVLISAITSRLKVRGIREDSSGNAGASVAAYAARAGLDCYVFTPATVSGPKAQQIEAYGAKLVRVEGDRNNVTVQAMRGREDSIYVGHVWHPYFWDGMRTIAYELYEQLGPEFDVDYIFLPVSAGTLLLGLLYGMNHLLESGLIDKIPKVVCAQTEAISPLYNRLKGTRYEPPKRIQTIADALVSVNPPLLDLMVRECKKNNAECIAIGEEKIVSSWKELSRNGFYVEPSSAVAYGAKKIYTEKGKLTAKTHLTILTGCGLKKYITQA